MLDTHDGMDIDYISLWGLRNLFHNKNFGTTRKAAEEEKAEEEEEKGEREEEEMDGEEMDEEEGQAGREFEKEIN